MKLFNRSEDSLYLTRKQWTNVFIAFSIMIIILYVIAMITSLCGSDYFILNYQNEQMNNIENFLNKYSLMPLVNWLFSTIEFVIILSFIIKKLPKWYYVLVFYGLAMIVSAIFPTTPTIFYQLYPFAFYLVIPIIEQLISNKKSDYHKKFDFKLHALHLLKLFVAVCITYIFQVMIYVIKTGSWSFDNHVQPLATAFVYAIEYDIALAVILFTILLYNREKGANKLWVMSHNHGGFSQTSKKQSLKSSAKKNLTKAQKNKIRLFIFKVYLIQIGTFLLIMVIPFLLGKVVEFLVMYLSFCVVRYMLGFNYSLHFKKEAVCMTVGIVVFGTLSLVVPFFYVNLICAIIIGIALALILHFSYKYKGFYLFAKMAKPDKFAFLYTIFDGDISERHIMVICKHRGLDNQQTSLIRDFMLGNKISYLAWKYNYSQRMLIYKLDEAIAKLNK